jgi:hypothetical protein
LKPLPHLEAREEIKYLGQNILFFKAKQAFHIQGNLNMPSVGYGRE